MRYGGGLQRRLLKLEVSFKVPDQREVDNRVVVTALTKLSTEDLLLLRDGAIRCAAGAAFEENPKYDEVLQRANALCVQALAEYNSAARVRV